MSNKPKDIEIKVEEEIKTVDVPPGASADSDVVKNKEKLPKEEVEKRQKIMLEYTRLLGRYVEPHNKKSRWVTKGDLSRVLSDGRDLVAMCNIPRGDYSGVAALAHVQIDDKDPLRFFVLQKGMVIINPVIVLTTKKPITKTEGCLSFPYEPIKENVERYNKITMIYQTLEKIDEKEPTISKPIKEGFSSTVGHIFQHEVSHCNGVNIYDDNYTPESCKWLGENIPMTEDEVIKLYEKEL
jgi:peptide deformylase